MKTIELQSKLALHDGDNVSIINPVMDEWFPYYISNPTGCTFHKIKVMVGSAEFGLTGGSIELELYYAPVTNANHISHKLSARDIKEGDIWKPLDNIQYTDANSSVSIRTAYKLSNVVIDEPVYVLGVLNVVGDVKGSNLFVWIDYENNQ